MSPYALVAAEGIAASVLRGIEKLAVPEEKIERIRVSTVSAQRITNEDELNKVLNEIRERALKLLKQNISVILE